MGIVVQKFGGTSVADTDKLFNVCKHITKEYDKGSKMVVVVSAQGKTTDKLILEEGEITSNPSKREHDVLVATGEQITIAKLTMCLEKLGYKAVSYMGWQIPIRTDNCNGNARIKSIDDTKILKALNNGNIVVVAGFQGINENGDITTLGRGGSDTTAVALAAMLKAEKCDIFTDVDGVYSSDPRIISDVKKIETITYDEMLELASAGAKVLHNRCVEIGKNFNIPIVVKSTFEDNSAGTVVKENKNLEDLYISGVAKLDNIARIKIEKIEGNIKKIYKIFNSLAQNNINIDMLSYEIKEEYLSNTSFTITESDLSKTLLLLKKYSSTILYDKELTKISLVGVGLANDTAILDAMLKKLCENDVDVYMLNTSEIKISILVDKNKADTAMKAIHDIIK